ncbi:YitT family protein [Listeria booriae]|uniref:Membrane protein n=1 Tax=Listeria booriae TaxID=1552123 RepID=A0A099VZ98_9LIST|nr:YitT family protein [Listeria booriae]KGL38914.1 membrane protein [Listeria booriae]MBC1211305.1 YitT family protein [Listeria booriae]MBC1227772.1 YitT family protein [Listeria booriae]MBC1230932.1 YitT family protein [Listeria booriae]MBC1234407.1 YitT family protein [Listeria booriae]
MTEIKPIKRRKIHPKLAKVMEYVYVIIGAFIIAVAFNVLLLPNHVASGGVSGISTIINYLTGWNPAYIQWAFNIPLFFAGVLFLGYQFGIKTFVGTMIMPFFVYITADWTVWTNQPLVAALFGGVLVGMGLGIVFRGKASTGGTDVIAQILHKFTHLSLGICVALIDGFVVIAAMFVFDIESGLYALIGLFATSKTIDLVQVGLNQSKTALIISEKQDEIRQAILFKIDRGITRLSAKGGYTDDERQILLCVIAQSEFSRLKEVIKEIDPNAFVVVMSASEVMGEGFNI